MEFRGDKMKGSERQNPRFFVKKALKWVLRNLDKFLVTQGARHRCWARLYYGLFNSAFTREQVAFLGGRVAYAESIIKPCGSLAVLRRNIHRLEKGLVMRPRRVPFGLDYIGETVDAYIRACRSSKMDQKELRWAHDVLVEYFAACGDFDAVRKLREQFEQAGVLPCPSLCSQTPYRRAVELPLRVSLEDLRELALRRRSVRWFLPRAVPREMVDRAIEIAIQAPSACNRQPYEFRVFDDPALVQKVVSIPYGMDGWGHNVPCVVVLVGTLRSFFDERDRHLIYIDGALAAMGFLYALECQGLSSCCVNWPDLPSKESAMAELLKLKPDERPLMVIALGYPDPDGMVTRSTKKSLWSIRRYNFE